MMAVSKGLSLIFTLAVLLISCNSSSKKQQRLSSIEEQPEVSENFFLESETVLETIEPATGIQFKEKRGINSLNPPVMLDFTQQGLPVKDPDLADYYSSVKYIKLKFPFPEKGSFLGETDLEIRYDRGMTSESDFYSRIYFSGDKIIAGDHYQGFYCFDSDGNYLYPIITPNRWPDYNPKTNTLSCQMDWKEKNIAGFSVAGDCYMLYFVEDGKGTMHFGNTASGKIYLQRPYYAGYRFYLLSPQTYLEYTYNPSNENAETMMYSFDIKGDTLCCFENYNPKYNKEKAPNSYSQNNSIIYGYDKQLSIRQIYNDTVFRLKSPSELQPAYVMNFGNQKQDIQSGHGGDNSHKLILQQWLEASGFVLITYSQDRDTPNNRKAGKVKFFYHFYDKKDKKLYALHSDFSPEKYLIRNSLENGIPIRGFFAKANEQFLIETFTKRQLNTLMKHESFLSLSESEQQNMKSRMDDLEDTDLLIMTVQ